MHLDVAAPTATPGTQLASGQAETKSSLSEEEEHDERKKATAGH